MLPTAWQFGPGADSSDHSDQCTRHGNLRKTHHDAHHRYGLREVRNKSIAHTWRGKGRERTLKTHTYFPRVGRFYPRFSVCLLLFGSGGITGTRVQPRRCSLKEAGIERQVWSALKESKSDGFSLEQDG